MQMPEEDQEGAPDDDHESMMNHCALECMHAIKTNDVDNFLDCFQALVADVLMRMKPDEENENVTG